MAGPRLLGLYDAMSDPEIKTSSGSCTPSSTRRRDRQAFEIARTERTPSSEEALFGWAKATTRESPRFLRS